MALFMVAVSLYAIQSKFNRNACTRNLLQKLHTLGIPWVVNMAARQASQVRSEMMQESMPLCLLFDDREETVSVDYTHVENQQQRGVIRVQRAGCVFAVGYEKDASIRAAIQLLASCPRLAIHVEDGAINCHTLGVHYPALPGTTMAQSEPYEQESIKALRLRFVHLQA
jgi:hypothetical protein